MPTAKLTKRNVDAAQPSERDVLIWDTELRGFGLKVTPAGGKVYIVQYRMGGRGSKTKRFTLGRHGVLTPDKAREMAEERLIDVRNGIDPMAARKSKRQEALDFAFEKYANGFLSRHAKRNRSYDEIARIFDRDITPYLKGRVVPNITRGEIARYLEDLADERTPSVANHAFANLRKMFNWAVERGDIPHSPMEGMRTPGRIEARDRVLSDAELKAIWTAGSQLGEVYCGVVRLLIATGQRRSEVTGMDWAEINRDERTWTIPASRAKNGQVQVVPLNALALEVLDGLGAKARKRGPVFPTVSNISRAKKKLAAEAVEQLRKDTEDAEASMAPWRLHDIRRTLATGLQRLGVRLEVTEAVLGHISGSRAGIVGVYQRHDWAPEKKAALDAWGSHVERLVSGPKASNVVLLQREGAA